MRRSVGPHCFRSSAFMERLVALYRALSVCYLILLLARSPIILPLTRSSPPTPPSSFPSCSFLHHLRLLLPPPPLSPGTHYFRMCNDGLQPWFASRDKFGIKSLRSYQLLRTEEGLATINTVLNARVKYLWYPALLYCKSALPELVYSCAHEFIHLSVHLFAPVFYFHSFTYLSINGVPVVYISFRL